MERRSKIAIIAISDVNYKLIGNMYSKAKEFDMEDDIMVRIHLECFPKTFFKKRHARANGSFSIARKFGPNAYLLGLPNCVSLFRSQLLTSYQL